jgi:lysylphosphatidylglycerol synthase-like protein
MRWRLVFLTVGGALFVYLVVRLGPGAILEMVRRIGWWAVAIAAIYIVYQALRAAALSASMTGPHPLPWREAVWVRLSGEAVQFLTFTGPFLAEPAKAWLIAGQHRGAVPGFAATLTEYLAYLFTGAVVAVVALGWLITRTQIGGAVRTTAIALVVIMLAFLAIAAWAIAGRIHLLGAILERVRSMPGVRAHLRPDMPSVHRTEDLLLEILHDRPARFAWIATLEAASHAVSVLELYAILRGLDLAAGLWIAFVIEGATKFVGLAFFFIPGQLGASEGAHAVVFQLLSLPAAAGFLVPFVRRIRSIAVAGIGLLAMSALTRRDRPDVPSRPKF